MNIEPLESRIAPAATFTYADVDGDFVTIKTTKGNDGELSAILTLVPEGLGMELREIDFNGWAIVEQDMYPAPFDKPLPIAKRTRAYLRQIGIG